MERRSLTHFWMFFLIGNVLLFCIAKKRYRTGSGPHVPSKTSRPRDTDQLRPSNLAARALSLVENTLSKFSGDPCPVRRGIVAAVKCFVRKVRFFAVRAGCGTQEKTRFSQIALPRCRDSSPLRIRIATKLEESVCSTKLRVLAAKFEGRRWSVSRGLA